MKIRNQRPGYKYCLVSLTGDDVATYLDMGWEACRWGKKDTESGYDGPHVLSGREGDRKKGAEIHARGCLLMEITEERHQEILDYGPDGASGYALSDALEERIVDKNGQDDPMRGISRRLARLVADPEHGSVETHISE